jgi:hypothetical protein
LRLSSRGETSIAIFSCQKGALVYRVAADNSGIGDFTG